MCVVEETVAPIDAGVNAARDRKQRPPPARIECASVRSCARAADNSRVLHVLVPISRCTRRVEARALHQFGVPTLDENIEEKRPAVAAPRNATFASNYGRQVGNHLPRDVRVPWFDGARIDEFDQVCKRSDSEEDIPIASALPRERHGAIRVSS
jgi:hypothetical protein